MKHTQKANAIIKIRVPLDFKLQLQNEAKGRGLTLTELITIRSKNGKLPDKIYENGIFLSIDVIAKEMNMIGNNINQATIAIHQIKNSQKIENGDFKYFFCLLEKYFESRNQLKDLLLQTQFNGTGI